MRFLLLALLIFSNSAFSASNPSCETLQHDLNELFQELSYTKGIACIYTSKKTNDRVTISFFEKTEHSFKKIAENNTFINLQDMQASQPFIDEVSDNYFQLVQYFPRDTYVVELQNINHTIKVKTIQKTIKLDSAISDAPPLLVTFSIKSEQLQTISFNELTQEQAFNGDSLKLAQSSLGKTIPITVEKALLFNAPNADQVSKSYLIKDDKVMLLSGNGEWLKIRYTNKNKSIDRWIRTSDIL